MPRYFLEVSYNGSNYSGFQKQENANSIQAEVEKALMILQKQVIELTGSSRTDAGVHALQNYFHFDFNGEIHPQFFYKMNAILPADIVVKHLNRVADDAHCRFDAVSRAYKYYIYNKKNPFLKDRAYYYPFTLNIEILKKAAEMLSEFSDFTTFSKRNTQVRSFVCNIEESRWIEEKDVLLYSVKANRFLRGMVRGLTGTMLQAGRGKISLDGLRDIINARDCSQANFSVPSKGLFLVNVSYPPSIL